LRPARKEAFEARYAAFAKKLATSLLGEKLAAKYDGDKLVRLYERGGLPAFLAEEGEKDLLGGWVKRLEKFQGTPFVGDHNMWSYFAERFGFKIVGFLEPKPGIAPTTRHLA
jgi:ABC-type Zn2+ transport system substrate-binding protein/surface adhesin